MRAPLLLALVLVSATAFAADPQPPPAPSAASPAAVGNTTVTFKNPDKFIDARNDGPGAGYSQRVLDALQAHIEKLGKQYLAAGQQLQVTVTEVDLAGRYDQLRNRPDWVRVMRDVDWPRIDLHYTLTQDGRTLHDEDVHLSDMSYLMNSGLQRSNEPLRYEKNMLDKWFAKTFGSKP